MTPQHHDKPMYRDIHDGDDMRRWLCAEPGCQCALPDDFLATMQELAWAQAHGILLPGVMAIGDEPGSSP